MGASQSSLPPLLTVASSSAASVLRVIHIRSPDTPGLRLLHFPRAAVRNSHRLVAYNKKNVFSSSSGSQKPEIKVFVRLFPSGGPKEVSLRCIAPSFRWLPATPGFPWLVAVSLQPLPLLSHGLLLCVSLCLKSPSPLSHQGAVLSFRIHLKFMVILSQEP